MNDKLKIKTSEQKGFTLLLSLLVISIILSVSFGVFDVMTKELKLSGIGRESQISFYAADAGVECAYYWDIKKKIFEKIINDEASEDIECANKTITVDIPSSENSGGVTTYKFEEFSFNMGEGTTQKCAKVKVEKVISEDTDETITTTIIESKGYNYFCESTSPHKVERAIRVISTKTEKAE